MAGRAMHRALARRPTWWRWPTTPVSLAAPARHLMSRLGGHAAGARSASGTLAARACAGGRPCSADAGAGAGAGMTAPRGQAEVDRIADAVLHLYCCGHPAPLELQHVEDLFAPGGTCTFDDPVATVHGPRGIHYVFALLGKVFSRSALLEPAVLEHNTHAGGGGGLGGGVQEVLRIRQHRSYDVNPFGLAGERLGTVSLRSELVASLRADGRVLRLEERWWGWSTTYGGGLGGIGGLHATLKDWHGRALQYLAER